jgi:predicted TIM-barrel enzyme
MIPSSLPPVRGGCCTLWKAGDPPMTNPSDHPTADGGFVVPPFVGEREAFTRQQILDRLHATIDTGRPIVGAGSSVGIVAKAAEAGGADLIICYSTGRSRIAGLPTTQIGHSNPLTLAMYGEIANVVDHTPIIGGAHAGDPTYRRLPELTRAFRETGFDGIINFPSVGLNPELGRTRDHIGQGLTNEYALIGLARSEDYFTLGYCYHVEQAIGLARAGVDVAVAHAGWTSGGAQGASTDLVRSLEQAAEHTQQIIDAVWKENPEAIVLAHGGAIAEPEDTEYLYQQTDAQGFVGASSIERIPIERAIRATVEGLKAGTPRRRAGR